MLLELYCNKKRIRCCKVYKNPPVDTLELDKCFGLVSIVKEMDHGKIRQQQSYVMKLVVPVMEKHTQGLEDLSLPS